MIRKVSLASLSLAVVVTGSLTEQTKHSWCHWAPMALTARSGIGCLHALHFGLCRRM